MTRDLYTLAMIPPVKGNENRESLSDSRRARANRRGMLPGIVGVVATSISLQAVNPNVHANAWTLIWWLLPVAFLLWAVLAGVEAFRRADEYQQRVQLESMAAGFVVAMLTAFTIQLLEFAQIGPTIAGEWVWLAGGVAWAGTLVFKTSRAR